MLSRCRTICQDSLTGYLHKLRTHAHCLKENLQGSCGAYLHVVKVLLDQGQVLATDLLLQLIYLVVLHTQTHTPHVSSNGSAA